MAKHPNLAGLPKDDALLRARAMGRSIFADDVAVSKVCNDLLMYWSEKNVPKAMGQSDDEFDELLGELSKEFEAGVDEAVKDARNAGQSAPTPLDIKQVANRCEQLFHATTALHDLTEELIQEPVNGTVGEIHHNFVAMREILRSMARDMENCAETLEGKPGSLGYFEYHFGKV